MTWVGDPLGPGFTQHVVGVETIPDDWTPQPLPFGHAQVVEAVRELAPDADTSDPEWMHVTLPGIDVEVSVTDQSPLKSIRAACAGR